MIFILVLLIFLIGHLYGFNFADLNKQFAEQFKDIDKKNK